MATKSLLQLVNEMQNVEASVISILYELTLKLSSLTSASVFLMVETDQRRVCGTPDLIERFGSDGLLSSPADVMVTLDRTATTTLSEQPLITKSDLRALSLPICSSNSASTPIIPSFPPYTKRKAMTGIVDPSHSCPKKRLMNPDLRMSNHNSDFSANHRSTFNENFLSIECRNLKTEISEVEFDGMDDDVEILDDCSPPSANSVFDNASPAVLPSTYPTLLSQSTSTPSLDSLVQSYQPNSKTFCLAALGVSSLAELGLNEAKVTAVQSLPDPSLAFLKGSPECKLISSVFYDFGKELRRRLFPAGFQDPSTRDSFISLVNSFMDFFPNLRLNEPGSPISKLKIQVGGDRVRSYTPEAFLRVNARNGFKVDINKGAK